jgi:hypothetical protein
MRRLSRVLICVAIAALIVLIACVSWTRTRSPEVVAVEDSSHVWISLLKGFEGEVVYLGDKGDKSYFRMGNLFWSYYKLPACRMVLLRKFALGNGEPYVVTLKNMPGGGGPTCPRKDESDQH